MKHMRHIHIMTAFIVGLFHLFGCSSYNVIPKGLEKHVSKAVTFEDIKAAPARYTGQLVVLGGEVLSAKRLEDSTRLEVLSLPLSEGFVPLTDRSGSGGRFYAFDEGKEILDPEVLDEGTPITVVGEVIGTTTGKIDEAPYEYPMVRIKDLTKWEKMQAPWWPYRYPYYGGAYWYGFRPYPFPYFVHRP